MLDKKKPRDRKKSHGAKKFRDKRNLRDKKRSHAVKRPHGKKNLRNRKKPSGNQSIVGFHVRPARGTAMQRDPIPGQRRRIRRNKRRRMTVRIFRPQRVTDRTRRTEARPRTRWQP